MGVSTHLTALIISERMPLSNHRVVRLKRTLSHVGDVKGRESKLRTSWSFKSRSVSATSLLAAPVLCPLPALHCGGHWEEGPSQ